MSATGPLSGKLTVETPEQVGIEFELAGIGSRFFAALIDFACMLVFLVIAIILALAGVEQGSEVGRKLGENASRSEAWTNGVGATATILILLAVFVVLWGYYIICEMLTGGASPGKRAFGLRVIRDNGLPITFAQSLVRNLVRIVDFMPWCYGVGLVTMFVSPRAQRLGDLAAGTLVVRAEVPAVPLPAPLPAPTSSTHTPRLSAEERQLVTRFFERELTLDAAARDEVLRAIVTPLRARLDPARTSYKSDDVWLRELMSEEYRHPQNRP
jgi:uncharacterized RDD family membrane protein YckC